MVALLLAWNPPRRVGADYPAGFRRDASIARHSRHMWTRSLASIAGAIAALGAVGVYLRILRPLQLRWGATDDEVARSLPGVEAVVQPTFNATRAVTISA